MIQDQSRRRQRTRRRSGENLMMPTFLQIFQSVWWT